MAADRFWKAFPDIPGANSVSGNSAYSLAGTALLRASDTGLSGVEWISSDAHVGLQAVRKAVLSGIPWQRSRFHLRQTASQYVLRLGMKREVAEEETGYTIHYMRWVSS